MESKKVFLVISEKREKITIRHRSKKVITREFCQICKKRVSWLTFEEVLQLTEKTFDEIKHDCENGQLDFQVTADGQVLICSNSFFRSEREIY